MLHRRGRRDARAVTQVRDGVRLLGSGELKAKLDLTVSGATKSAVAAVEKAGGKITVTEPKKTEAEASEA